MSGNYSGLITCVNVRRLSVHVCVVVVLGFRNRNNAIQSDGISCQKNTCNDGIFESQSKFCGKKQFTAVKPNQ